MALGTMQWLGRGLLTCALGLSLTASSAVAQAPKPRKWKDASGQFEIEATFVSEANGTVTLKQTNGEEVEIELKQLSPADEAYVRVEQAKLKTPFKSKSSSPFQQKAAGNSPATGGEPVQAASTSAPPAISIDWTTAALISPPDQIDWKAVSIQPSDARKAKSSQLPAKRDFFEKFTSIATGDGFAILGYALPDTFKKGNPETTRLVRVNLETGKVEGTIIAEGAYALMDVSPGGDELLMRKELPAGQESTDLEIWKPAGKMVERLKAFTPFGNDEKHHQQVEIALLGTNGRIVVSGRLGRAGIFDAATGNAVATLPKGYAAALSPDRKYAAVLGESLFLVDLALGEAIASLPTDKHHGSTVGFSPDGQRIAAAVGNKITVWNLKDGEVFRDETFAAMSAYTGRPLQFTSPDHVLVGSTLIDLENHIPLWSFTGVEAAASYGASTLMVAERGNQGGTLVAAALPHPAAVAALRQALANPALFAVKPGTSISVDVGGLPDAGEQQKAKAGLEASLTAAGMKVVPGAPVVLRASMTSANEERQFRTLGAGFDTKSITTTKYTSKVELVAGGQSAWETSAVSGAAHFVSSKPGESLEDAIKRSNQPNYSFFSAVSIPQYVMQPGKTTLGNSHVNGPGF